MTDKRKNNYDKRKRCLSGTRDKMPKCSTCPGKFCSSITADNHDKPYLQRTASVN